MKEKIKKIFNSIDEISKENKSQTVQVIAVSKKKSCSEIIKANKLGIENFGENYLQESLEKIENLKNEKIIWHFIGKIQSNKCKDIAENFAWVHTLDRLKIAVKLNKHVPEGKKLKILIQVNLDNDLNKGGIKKEEVVSFKREVQKLSNLDFNGIMIMPSVNADDDKLKLIYEEAWKLAREICEPNEKKCELSMGMTHDFKIAVEAGSSMVRIGTGIFGERE
ncbi:YggS family pyridoxal phosphate-dependent enzyme [SAR86 cluster bacterium]|nr:YggS family pyridoxal phosphate-dependent enzyme [SAR86 cluster bacterium]